MSQKKNRIRRNIWYFLKPSVGKLLGILMAAYFVFTFFSIRNRVQVNFYEVEEGSLVKEHIYTGIILRDETIVNSADNGYIYYYVADGRKVANGNRVYSIDETGDLMNYLNTHASEIEVLNSSKVTDIRTELLHDSRSFSDRDFKTLYTLKDTLDAHVIEYASMNIFSSMSEQMRESGINFREYRSDTTGTVCTYTDGYEDVSETELSSSLFNQSAYKRDVIKSGDTVTTGNPAYKLITSENWMIAFPMDKEDVDEFRGRDTLRISFSDKDFSTQAGFKVISGADGNQYGLLSLDSYQIQFTSDRFVKFEIVTNDVSGLKIPDKSITTKDFSIIPVRFLTMDENGNQGFYKAVVSESGTGTQFVIPEIYNTDEEYCYVDCKDDTVLRPGDYVISSPSDTEDRYQIGPVKGLKGVYNINKGYAVFKKVEILESANGYSIVRKNSSYGLSVYDHIVLDTETVHDGQLLYR